MPILTSQTTITIVDKLGVTTALDFTIQPENFGSNALRELRYPGDVLAPIVYEQNPDSWTNFDSGPMVKRPSVSKTATITDNRLTGWFGYTRDRTVTETWRGSDSEASISLTFLRQLYAYFENPPINAFIQWSPKDRTNTTYNIVINSLNVDGPDIGFNFLAARQNCALGDVRLTFTIIGEV